MTETQKKLQEFAQRAVDSAWNASQINSPYDANPTGFGQHLESTLQARSSELSRLLNQIAEEELNKENHNLEPIDFTKFVRISNQKINHKEVFVGDKWVLVPSDANINFNARTDSYAGTVCASFEVTISCNGDSKSYYSSETYQQYQGNQPLVDNEQLLVKGKNLSLNDGELNWMNVCEQTYGVVTGSTSGLNNTRILYDHTPKPIKRKYAYKLSKVAPKAGKSGKIFHGTQKLAKNAKFLGPVANILTIGTIGYEWYSDTWDAHTIVNGGLLVVGIAAATFGAAPIVVGIAIYGILDLVFNVGEGIDDIWGRDSRFWNNQPIESYPTELSPLFQEARINNTYVAPQFIKPLDFKY